MTEFPLRFDSLHLRFVSQEDRGSDEIPSAYGMELEGPTDDHELPSPVCTFCSRSIYAFAPQPAKRTQPHGTPRSPVACALCMPAMLAWGRCLSGGAAQEHPHEVLEGTRGAEPLRRSQGAGCVHAGWLAAVVAVAVVAVSLEAVAAVAVAVAGCVRARRWAAARG